jgi:anaphase-promoting complex subunit 2
VLELLKIRFGEGALQACEVMLRDVLDSKRVDAVIRADQNLHLNKLHISKPATHLSPQPPHAPELHAKILSRLFWPSLHEETFAVPLEISELQERYERGFETLKQSRKLTWLPALGQVTVELDLQDRIVTEEVQPWHASVIYAFQDPDASEGTETKRTVAELTTQLSMAEGLVRNALTFWVGKLVLKEVEKDTFRVLETLDQDGTGKETAEAAVAAAAEVEASSAVTALKSNEEVQMENMKVYWQFIVGMLTNQGAMPLQGIIMMLKMAVPGGFPFSSEELREFLSLMVNDGKLEVLGGNYKIKH